MSAYILFQHHGPRLAKFACRRVLLCAAIVAGALWAQVAAASGNLLVDPGFETAGTRPIGSPAAFGLWDSDATTRGGANQGITPAEGSFMLRFDATTNTSASSTQGSDLDQIVDLSSYVGSIQQGNVVARLSAQFNRVAGDAQTDTEFRLRILAESGTVSNRTILADSGFISLFSDSDLSTWETLNASLLLPTGTTMLVARAEAYENVFNNTSSAEFDGHYIDNVVLTVPEPSTGAEALVLVVCLAACYRKGFRGALRGFRFARAGAA